VQPQAHPSPTPSAGAGRPRPQRARRGLFHGLRLGGAIAAAVASAVVAACVFSLHVGIHPVLTGSMEPDYGPGALLVTRQVPTSTLKPGMIVLFVPPGEHVQFAHRITSVAVTTEGAVVTTKGDRNRVPDPWHARITATRVSAVVGSVPEVGRLLVDIRGTGQIVLALLGGLVAVWAGTRWIFNTPSRPPGRRMTAGGT